MTAPGALSSSDAILHGIAASPGVALGPVFLYTRAASLSPPSVDQTTPARSADEEQTVLRQALAAAIQELRALSAEVRQRISQEEAGIFEAQAMMLEDPTLIEAAASLIKQQGLDATSALFQAGEEQTRELESLEDETLAARAADLRDAVQRVMRHLQGGTPRDLAALLEERPEPVILVAHDLLPSETARLRPRQVLGICTASGGATSHAAILARALGIPAVVGVGEELLARCKEVKELALDGTEGSVYLTLPAERRRLLLEAMVQQRKKLEQQHTLAAVWRHRPGATADGHPVSIAANIGSGGPTEAREAVEQWGAEGVGLLRTEFLVGDRPSLPDENEQFEQYLAVFRAFASSAPKDAPLIARTLDAGADKPAPALTPLLGEEREENPALGVRGIRIHLAYPELLRTQIRALVRAAGMTGVALHIMFPMIATVEETRQAKAVFERAWEELSQEEVALPGHVPVGIMVEVPSAVLLAEELAQEAEFFSIGTNDLSQYLLAADRLNGRISPLADARQPAVVRAIAQVAQAAKKRRRLIAVCGEAAGDLQIGPLLVGLGVEELSMAPARIPPMKEALSRYTAERLGQLAERALCCGTLDEVQSCLEEEL